MKPSQTLSKGALVAVAALCLLGLIGGWLILLSGGFHHMTTRYSKESVFVDGAPALLMATISFMMSVIAVAAFLQAINSSRFWYYLLCGMVIIPPLLFSLR